MHNSILVGTWAVACSSMSIFTLLPAIKTEDVNMMYVLLIGYHEISRICLEGLSVYLRFNAVI